MSHHPDIEAKLCRWASETLHIDLDEVTNQAGEPIRDVVDSVAMLGLVCFIEETFRIECRDEEITPENFFTIRTIADFVADKVRQRPA